MVVPTVTVITVSGNYTPPVGFKYIKVHAIGGGGRGGAATAQGASGGGAGQVVFDYYNTVKTYTVVIGTNAGSGAAITNTVFDGVLTANGGSPGTDSSAATQRGGFSSQTISDKRLFATSGYCGGPSAAGNGGSNMFGSGGRGAVDVSSVNGGNGVGFGGGGGGGFGAAGSGGAGSAGAVIVFEYY